MLECLTICIWHLATTNEIGSQYLADAAPNPRFMDEPENRAGAGEITAVVKSDGRFVAGKSGNRGGRPRIPDEVKQALLAATPDAVAELVRLSNSAQRDADRISAAEIIIERVLGKAAQPITGADGGPI